MCDPERSTIRDFFKGNMFFSKIDRQEFELLKNDLFFLSGELGKIIKRIEALENKEREKKAKKKAKR